LKTISAFECRGGDEVAGKLVIAGGDTPLIFRAEEALDLVPPPVKAL
jgi:hypothetical protein